MNEEQVLKRIASGARGAQLSAAGVNLGIGDDAALFASRAGRETILTCDWSLEGTHFLRDASSGCGGLEKPGAGRERCCRDGWDTSMLLAEPGAACFPYRPVARGILAWAAASLPRFSLRTGRRRHNAARRDPDQHHCGWRDCARTRLAAHRCATGRFDLCQRKAG